MNAVSRTTILGILVLAGRRLSAAQLIRLAEPLGLSATNVKSHLTRMVAEGVLEREGPARLATYRPSGNQSLVINGIQARLNPCDEPWGQTWIMLALRLPPLRRDKEMLRASLWFGGWRPTCPDVFVRPAWPRTWAEESARQYLRNGLGFCVCGVAVAAPKGFEALYDLQALDSEAHRLATWIERRIVSVRSPRAAFVERMKVGGRVARFIGHDPRLPPDVWGRRRGMQEMVNAFQQFEDCIAPEAQKFLDQNIEGQPAIPDGPRRKG
jgi:DNA-binding transcriptional regulator PaaX